MAVKKISISLDAEVFARAKRAAEAEGVALSTWLSEAAEEAVGLDKAGVGQGETTEEAAARMAALARLRGERPAEPRRRAG